MIKDRYNEDISLKKIRLDDDNIFYADAFYQMQEFLINHKDFVGVAFNQIYNYLMSQLGRSSVLDFQFVNTYLSECKFYYNVKININA